MEPLDESIVRQSFQRPALVAYVPLMVFIAECFVGLALLFFLKFWAACFAPIHMWFVSKTSEDFHWVKALWADFLYTRFFVSNKGLYGKDVISFTACAARGRERHA